MWLMSTPNKSLKGKIVTTNASPRQCRWLWTYSQHLTSFEDTQPTPGACIANPSKNKPKQQYQLHIPFLSCNTKDSTANCFWRCKIDWTIGWAAKFKRYNLVSSWILTEILHSRAASLIWHLFGYTVNVSPSNIKRLLRYIYSVPTANI